MSTGVETIYGVKTFYIYIYFILFECMHDMELKSIGGHNVMHTHGNVSLN